MKKLCQELRPGRYLVLGDIMVDEYNVGTVSRISPEAPIPVLNFENCTRAPGGAANVALNLAALGNEVELVGVTGRDEPGRWLRNYLTWHDVGISGIIADPDRITTRKVRFATVQQSILRVDFEDTSPVADTLMLETARYIEKFLRDRTFDGLLVSDYGKGLITAGPPGNPLIPLLAEFSRMPFLCGADTKKNGIDLRIFSGFDFIKPNLAELVTAVGIKGELPDSLPLLCHKYLEMSRAKSVLVTLGPEGMYHYDGRRGTHVRAVAAGGYDVTGAGDTAFAVAMQALANERTWTEVMRWANIAASVALEARGTKAVTMRELVRKVELVENAEPHYFNIGSGPDNL